MRAFRSLIVSFLQSDRLSLPQLIHILALTNIVVKETITHPTASVAVDNDSGLLKFGGDPSGDWPAGVVQRSALRGRESIALALR